MLSTPPTLSAYGMQAALLLAAYLLTIVHFAAEPLRWKTCYLPRGMGLGVAYRVRDAIYCTALASYLLPFKMGIPLRLVILRRESGMEMRPLGATIALDAGLSMVAWAGWVAVCMWAAALKWRPPAATWWLVIAGLTGALVLLFCTGRSIPSLGNIREAFAAMRDSSRRAVLSLAVLAGDVFSYGLRHACLIWLVGGDPALLAIGGAIGIVATFAGIVSGLPLGLLGYDASLVGLMVGAGFGAKEAISVALLNRGMNLLCAALLGLPAAMRLGLGTGISSIVGKLKELLNERR